MLTTFFYSDSNRSNSHNVCTVLTETPWSLRPCRCGLYFPGEALCGHSLSWSWTILERILCPGAPAGEHTRVCLGWWNLNRTGGPSLRPVAAYRENWQRLLTTACSAPCVKFPFVHVLRKGRNFLNSKYFPYEDIWKNGVHIKNK